MQRRHVLASLGGLALPAHARQGAQAMPATPATTLRIGAVYRHMTAWTASQLLRHVFESAGIGLRLVELPSARAEVFLASGEIDGEAARIPQYGRLHPELIRVDPPIYSVSIHAYSRRSRHLEIRGREDLVPLLVGYQASIVYATELVTGLPHIEVAQTPALLYRMLQADRVDAIIDASINARRREERYGVSIDESALLARHDVHMYLRAEQARHVPALSAAIRKLMAGGRLASLTQQYEGAAMKLPPQFD